MHATRRVKLKDISSNLTCHLCQGYFVDATTIIECLHSFCRGCIVPHLEKSEYCPVCEVQLHSSKPLSSIRSDQMLQEIVYKLVPGLFQNEMARRRKHYKERSEMKPTSQQDAGHVFNESYITSDDIIHLSLELQTENTKIRESSKRYIKCPAAVSISILKKLLQGKYDLSSSTSIEILYRDRTLPDDFLLMDIAYKYFWSQNEGKPLQLCYKFIGVLPDLPKPMRPSLSVPAPATATVSTPKRRKSEINAKTPATPLTESKQKKPKKTLLTPKSSNGNGNGTPTPNGKLPRGRPKRKIEAEDGDDTVNKPVEKKPKKDKEAKVKTPKTLTTPKLKLPKKSAKSISTSATATANGNGPIESGGAEVQLRISENGVISATSVSSGEEKIIVKNPPRPVLATSPTLFTSYPRNFSNEDVPSLTISSELLKRPGVTNGSGHNGKSSGHNGNGNGHNGNGHEQVPKHPKSPDKVTISPKDSNGNIFHPWKYSPEKRSRKPVPPNGKIPHDTQAMSPTKRHQTTIINGDFKFTPIISAVKTPPKNGPSTDSSSPKKPPKFFKSRHTEMRTTGTETNGDINGKSPVKFPENEFIISAAMFNKTLATGGLFLPNDSSKSPPKTQKTMTSQSMTMTPPTTSATGPGFGSASPAPMLDHFSSFRYPMNMNLAGLQNNLPMNLVPFMPNQYQFQPFFNNGSRPNVHAANQALMANALAMSSLNMNLPYPGFPQNPNNNVNANASNNPNPNFRPHQVPSPSNPNTTLDLSMPSRKPVSSYVQISPKKMSQSQKEPLSFKKGQSPVKRDKGLKSSSQKKTPNKSQPQPMVTEPPNGPTSLNSTTPEKIDVPVILSTIQTDALDFCHGVTTEKAATTVTSVPVPTVAADSPTHNNNNVVSNGKNEHKSPEPETNGHDLGVNLNSPTSSSSPTSNNNNNIPAGAKKLEPSPLLPEPMDSDDDDGGNNLIISESDPSIPTSCGPAVSVNVISSSNTSSA